MAATGEVSVRDEPANRRYAALDADGTVAGFVDYRGSGETVVLVHTEVDPAFEGRGVGGALARFALDDLRRRGLAADPACPFIRTWVERHPDYADLTRAATSARSTADAGRQEAGR